MNPERRANQLTSGSLSRGLLTLAAPMFVTAFLQNAQSLIDLFWVGRLGPDAVAALALSGTILMMVFPFVMGMSTGTVAFVSRNVGAQRYAEAAEAAGQSLVLAVVLGIVAGAVGWYLAEPLCRLLGADPHVLRLATEYLRISFLGIATVFLLFTCNSVFLGAGHPVLPMTALLLSNVLNMILAPFFIFGLLGLPRLEVGGAALATVIAQALAALLVLTLLWSRRSVVRVRNRDCRPNPGLAWRILRIGLPSSGQMLARSLTGLVLMRIVAACGSAAVAGYGIGLRIHMLVLMPAFTLGNATATMVGQNLGAGRPDRAQRSAWLATWMDVGIMAVAAAALMFCAPAVIRAFTRSPDVVATGAAYLRTVSPFYVFTALAVVLGRALQGAGDTVAPMVLTVACLWGLQVPLAVWFARVFTPATQGIWWSIGLAVTVHGILTALWFQTGRWKARTL